MKRNAAQSPDARALRQRAEQKLRENQPPSDRQPMGEADVRALVHELQVHQIELEMQNEELLQAQVEAQDKANKFSELFDFAPIAYFELDTHGVIREVNLAGAAQLGLNRNAVAGQSFLQHVVPESRQEYAGFLQAMQKCEGKCTCELRLLRHGGTPCDVQVDGVPVQDGRGNGSGCRLTVVDITLRKHQNRALQEAHDKTVTVLESITDAFFSLDRDFCVTYVNCEAERILQKTKQEMVGRNLWELFPEAVGSRFQIEYQRCLAENQTVHFDEFYPPFKRWFAVHAYPSDIGLSVYFNDITTHKHTEETLSFLAQCGRTNSGEDFFQLLARYLAQRLSMDFVCIDQLQEGSLAVQTVAVYFDGKYEDNQSYTLKDTPCGEVVGKTICCFPQDVRHRFPKDAVLQEMRAESYVGVTLWSSQGQAIGLIAVIGRQPLADAQPAKAMLQLVAVRAAAELERRQADEALRASEERLQLAQQAGRIGAFDRNLRTDETFWTKELEEIYGLPPGGFQGSFAKWQESIHPDDRPAVDEMIRQSIADHSSFQMEFRILWPDGSLHWIAAWGRVICDKQGQPIRSVGVNMEISDRKRAEEVIRKLNAELEQRVADRTCELRRANQMLHMVSKCDEALVRISSERDLIQEVCRIINEVGGYRMVWVGFAEQDKRRTVRVVASAGFDVGCLDTIPITWADNKFGRDPTGTAIRTGRICQGEDFLSDGRLAAWHKIAREHVFRSSIALPLVAGGQAFGALTIFAVQPHAFDPAQVRLLSELVDDLSFGITALRVHADRDHARRELEQRTAQLRSLAAELAQTEQRERRRIAQVLHDQLQQLLVGARYQLDGMQVGSSSADFAQARQQVDNLLSQCLETSRSLTLELSPPILDEAGLIAALKWLGRWFRETHGLAVRVIADDQVRPEREEIRVTLFQAVRELLFNVVKHARVQQARVRVSRLPENQIKIVVSDRGTGFDPKRLRMKEGAGAGIGLFSLRERLDWLGGRMEIDSAAGRGSRFTLWVPLKRRRKIPSTLVHNDLCAF